MAEKGADAGDPAPSAPSAEASKLEPSGKEKLNVDQEPPKSSKKKGENHGKHLKNKSSGKSKADKPAPSTKASSIALILQQNDESDSEENDHSTGDRGQGKSSDAPDLFEAAFDGDLETLQKALQGSKFPEAVRIDIVKLSIILIMVSRSLVTSD